MSVQVVQKIHLQLGDRPLVVQEVVVRLLPVVLEVELLELVVEHLLPVELVLVVLVAERLLYLLRQYIQ